MFRQFQQMLERCCLILFIFYYHVLLLHLPHVSTIEAVVGRNHSSLVGLTRFLQLLNGIICSLLGLFHSISSS